MKHLSRQVLFFCGAVLLFSCGEEGPNPNLVRVFDQQLFLQNTADNLIIPAYRDLADKTIELDSAIGRFIAAPNPEGLAASREALKAAWISWQYCAPFEFGPAELLDLSHDINVFPADTAKIEANILAGFNNLGDPANSHARGFPALDYLLNNPALSDSAVISNVFNRASVAGYLVQVARSISFSSQAVHQFWAKDGQNYYAIFTADQALGNEEGSSLSDLVIGLCKSMELLTRNQKVGIPLGLESAGESMPNSTEAFYGSYSVELLKTNISAMRLIFEGKSRSGAEGLGFDEYVDVRTSGNTGATEVLKNAILTRYDLVNSAASLLVDPLSGQIANSPAPVAQVFNQLTSLMTLYKEDMATALRVEVVY